MLCEKPIKRGVMTEYRPCIQEEGHKGACKSPDLTGLIFGNLKVIRQAAKDIKGNRMWVVLRLTNGVEEVKSTSRLMNGDTKGIRSHLYRINGYKSPEYSSVSNHWRAIFRSQTPNHRVYKGMPFYDEWNPDKGGVWWRGSKWIIENLGNKPSSEWSLDIIKHELGFVPGNLRWALRNTQRRNQRHRALGQLSDQEFIVEAQKRGFVLTKKT